MRKEEKDNCSLGGGRGIGGECFVAMMKLQCYMGTMGVFHGVEQYP